ncbi:MAG: gliding motility-associated C-terminal domain-containing protein [Bacteroidales bacterium]|nr:gliding motility-associated C-terminal domain-containing protein [Bacteroidales bacterium]
MKVFKYILLIIGFVFLAGSPGPPALPTHNRAGEITYEQIGDLSYRITIITYTATGPGPVADREHLEVEFGDGITALVKRIEEVYLPDYYKRNKYVWEHTFPGPGTYQIVVEDPNRNKGVKNIPNSVQVVFSIKTILIINPEIGYNSTPVLLNPPIDKAAKGYTFIHNPAAFDPDGDSLSYKLAICTGEDGREIKGYTLPPFTDSLLVNELTGDLIWAAPADTGKYNVAMTIEEWRKGVQIGRIQRDMQIEVFLTDNKPPEIEDIGLFCILANEEFSYNINAIDPDNDSIQLEASGGPLSLKPDPATFKQTMSVPGRAEAHFSWQTNCDLVRAQPYLVIIKAKDRNPELQLIDSKNLELYVHSPAPPSLTATPGSASIQLDWDACPCSNNTGYKIYRKVGSRSFDPDECEIGVPEELGYKLIEEIEGAQVFTYSDNNHGNGLQQATEYCYRITAVFADGAESFASNEACSQLVQGSPMIIQVSVLNTDLDKGEIQITWLKPDLTDVEDVAGPFIYRVYRSEGMFMQEKILVDSLDGLNSTTFIDKNINTQLKQWSYQVELVNADPNDYRSIGVPQVASSVFLDLLPYHASLDLRYNSNVPWENRNYSIFELIGGSLDSIASTNAGNYRISDLEDGEEYCYKVIANGFFEEYSLGPMQNHSQLACGIPIDSLAPCPPILTGQSICDSLANHLIWNNVNDSCSSDAKKYSIYYRTSLDGEMVLLDSVSQIKQTNYWHFPEGSMAACYAVTATDSVGNESEYSNIVCLDACINYELPNVFTPNGDGINDLLRPFPYNLVDRIELKIFSRWGNTVFETRDPDINWDGKHFQTGKLVSSGVYYYICDVYEKRLTGMEPRYLVGFIHVIYGGDIND